MTDVSWLATGPRAKLILATKPGLPREAAAQAAADADTAIALARRIRIPETPGWVRFVERTAFVWIALFCVAAFVISRNLGRSFWGAVWIATTPAVGVGLLLVTGATVWARERRKKQRLSNAERSAAEAGLNRAARSVREVSPRTAALVADLLRADRSLERRVHDLVWRSATRPLTTAEVPVEARQALDELDALHRQFVPENT